MKNVKYFLKTMPEVRKSCDNTPIPCESGKMISVGKRIDYKTGAETFYLPFANVRNKENDMKRLKQTAFLFNKAICNSICKTQYEKDISEMETIGMTLPVNSTDCTPTYVCSRDLTNSPHLDYADTSQSYALFYRSGNDNRLSNGVTWFMFPYYGIAIELSGPTYISFNGRTMYHCSLTTCEGIESICSCPTKRLNQVCTYRTAFSNRQGGISLKRNDEVVVRKKNSETDPYDRFVYVKAHIIELDGMDITVLLNSSQEKMTVSSDNVIPVPYVKKFLGYEKGFEPPDPNYVKEVVNNNK